MSQRSDILDLTDDEELIDVFTNCSFHQDIDGISICSGYCAPCRNVIEMGACDALIKYFNGLNED